MSSPASAFTVELPRWPLADLLSVALALAAACVLEAVRARYPGAPAGAGVAAAGLLVTALWLQRRRRPRAFRFVPGAGQLRAADGRELPFAVGDGSRLLGTSVVLHWRSAVGHGGLWLTPFDLPREILRALAVRLAAGGRAAGQ